jgi:Reverse transcriptase (RNA-dependent DNA polymerase)
MNLLHGAQTCININGTPTQYFQCKRGLRQGDPLSPFLFDLVTDILCQIMNRGTDLNLIQGLGPRLSNGHKCSHSLYADDTIFFLPANSGIIENVTWALVAFESLTGIKINYDKTEMVPMNLTEDESHQYAALIGCNISHFLIKYLGLPLHDRTLKVSDWDEVVVKVQNKLAN